jgi:amino acid permease
MVIFHVLAGFHVFLFPLLDYIDGVAIKKGLLPSALLYRLVVRSSLVLLISFVAAAIPFFEVVLGLLGALSITPTTFIMPCLLFLKLRKPRAGSWEFWFCCVTVPVMTVIMFLGAAGAIREFIVKVVKDKEGGRPFQW